MSDLSFTDPCILFALRREARAFQKVFPPHQRFPGSLCRARFCGPEWLTVLTLETGVGLERMEKALGWLLGEPRLGNVPYRPKVVISAGFSGGLQENLKVGNLILATDVVDTRGNAWPTTWPGELPAGEWRPPLSRGRLVCTPKLLGSAEDKLMLGKKYGAVAVDMETAAVARFCSRKEIPFGCLRVISDDLHTPLSPRLAALVERGTVSPLRFLGLVLTAPKSIGEMWRLARDTRLAADRLAQGLGELLTLTLPWGKDL